MRALRLLRTLRDKLHLCSLFSTQLAHNLLRTLVGRKRLSTHMGFCPLERPDFMKDLAPSWHFIYYKQEQNAARSSKAKFKTLEVWATPTTKLLRNKHGWAGSGTCQGHGCTWLCPSKLRRLGQKRAEPPNRILQQASGAQTKLFARAGSLRAGEHISIESRRVGWHKTLSIISSLKDRTWNYKSKSWRWRT